VADSRAQEAQRERLLRDKCDRLTIKLTNVTQSAATNSSAKFNNNKTVQYVKFPRQCNNLFQRKQINTSMLTGTGRGRPVPVKYVSSANLHSEFPAVAAARSPAVTTYAAGPMTDPGTILAVILRNDDHWSLNTVL